MGNNFSLVASSTSTAPVPRQLLPPKVKAKFVSAGSYHTFVKTNKGILVCHLGDTSDIPAESFMYQEVFEEDSSVQRKAHHLPIPTMMTNLNPTVEFVDVFCGTHHSILLAKEGGAYSFGFGESYQLGQGLGGEDVNILTKIENTAIRNVMITHGGGGGGGQFTVLMGDDEAT